jgi:tRNA threonylcarbamoyladenosine biosynthesis protein TsaE
MEKIFFSNSEAETKKIAQKLAKEILRIKEKKESVVLGLEGDLGGGKTTFLQGFAKGLGIKEKILSPTFVIMKKFPLSKGDFLFFFHLDSYRTQSSKDFFFLRFEEIVSNPKHVIAIEWADKVKDIMPQKTIWIKFILLSAKKRKIIISK